MATSDYYKKNRYRFGKSRTTPALRKEWDKYGEEPFEFVIIERVPIDQLIERENVYLKYLFRRKISPYNSSCYSEENHARGCKRDPESIQRALRTRSINKERSNLWDRCSKGATIGWERRRLREKEEATWDEIHSMKAIEQATAYFKDVIFPQLKPFSIKEIAAETGLGNLFVSNVMKGKSIPHPIHNAKLMELIQREKDPGP